MSGSEMRDEVLVDHWRSITSGVSLAERRIGQVLEDFGLSPQWFAVLNSLLRAEGYRSPMSALAREVSMTSGGFTKLADRMARDGLIDRRSSADDRRVVHAALTADGLAVAQRAARLYQHTLREYLLGVVPLDDLASAAATIGTLSEAHPPQAQVEDAGDLFVADGGTAQPDRRRGPSRE